MVTSSIVSIHFVLAKGIEIDKSKIEVIANLPAFKTVREIRYFQGYVRFIRGLLKDLLV